MGSPHDPEYRRFLRKLRAARKEAGLTQVEVAKRLGRHQSFVTKSETGERRVDVVELARFARLYGKAQDRLNRFTLRHLDFYYREVLRARNRAAEPRAFHLLLAATGGGEALRIPRGTGFSAGRDENFDDIVYRADVDTRVSDTRLEKLATLYLQRDPLIAPEADLAYVARIADPEKKLYRRFGLEERPRLLRDPEQLPGVFLLRDGEVQSKLEAERKPDYRSLLPGPG